MAQPLTLNGLTLTIKDLQEISAGRRVALSDAALARVRRSAKVLATQARDCIIYGVNTGFGPMASTLIGKDDLGALQRNLILSHACGVGQPVKDEYVFGAMAVRLNTLLRGDSGASAELLILLAALINGRCAPIVPEHGGVGASGDLLQLSHIALVLIGEGEVRLRGRNMSAGAALKKLKLRPHVLGPKEGLALINGTSFMTAVAALTAHEAGRVFAAALRASALALEMGGAFDDCLAPYLHAARPHRGQQEVAARLRTLTRQSQLLRSRQGFERSQALKAGTVQMERMAQDIYSLRCAPQILGPVQEALLDIERTIKTELNSATDNPLIDAAAQRVLHGGNFHGEYIAVAMDRLKQALAKVSLLSERRLNYFLHDKINGLFPPFLNLGTPGLTLGLQGLQFVATSTAAQNQSLAYPHALHSIPSNADNQDVVSMGADAALFAARVTENAAVVLSAELVALSQAGEVGGRTKRLSPEAKALVRAIRRRVPVVRKDRPLWKEVQNLAGAIRNGEVLKSLGR